MVHSNMEPASMDDAGDTASQFQSESGPRRPKKGLNVGCLVMGLTLVILGVVAATVGPMIMNMFKRDALVEDGVAAPCTILSVRETNSRVNHRWVYDLELEVRPEGMAPYQTEVSQPFSQLHSSNLRAGVGCQVHYDKEDPKMVVVMSTGGPVEIPGMPKHKETPEVCRKARDCCLKSGAGDSAACESLVGGHVPESVCETSLNGSKLAAEAKGVSCD